MSQASNTKDPAALSLISMIVSFVAIIFALAAIITAVQIFKSVDNLEAPSSRSTGQFESENENYQMLLQRTAPLSVRNCDDIKRTGASVNGLYSIFTGNKLVQVYCEFDRNGSNWMVIQRRINGSVDFYLNWNSYVYGFGNKREEFWLGLQTLHEITNSESYMLRIDLEDWVGNKDYVVYKNFHIGNLSSNYLLTANGYSGPAVDALSRHNGQQFSTKDRDNDASTGNCAVTYEGAWWYWDCLDSNLNGKFGNFNPNGYSGLTWLNWRFRRANNGNVMRTSSMKIRPN